MSNAFSRSWQITKLSFNVIKQDKELLLFPVLAGIFSIIFIISLIFPSIVIPSLRGVSPESYGITEYFSIFIAYIGLSFIATFFNVCVVFTAKKRFAGGNATFIESIKFAFSKIHLILSWSLMAATVGLLLRVIERMAERAGQGGRMIANIITSILGLAWGIVTIFVIPGMVYYNLSPFEAIKRSVQTLKKTWGESLIRYYGLGLIQFLFLVLGVVLFIPSLLVAVNLAGLYGIIAAITIIVLYFLIVILIFSVANTVFNTALFVYADTGKIPEGYNQEIMRDAFRQRRIGGRGIV